MIEDIIIDRNDSFAIILIVLMAFYIFFYFVREGE